MTRHPASDECSVPRKPVKYPVKERFFVTDLAKYLRVTPQEIGRFARAQRLARFVKLDQLRADRPGRKSTLMVLSAGGAARVIEHFRAKQGAIYEQGRDWAAEQAKRVENGVKRWDAVKARKRAEREQEARMAALARLNRAPVSSTQGGPDH